MQCCVQVHPQRVSDVDEDEFTKATKVSFTKSREDVSDCRLTNKQAAFLCLTFGFGELQLLVVEFPR